jgi:predicted secreted Zn-dependent protease
MVVPSAASAASKSNPTCKKVEKQLTAKIKRLKKLAAERRAQGDAYGERRLKSLANVIAAHRGNLPCVNSQTCSI